MQVEVFYRKFSTFVNKKLNYLYMHTIMRNDVPICTQNVYVCPLENIEYNLIVRSDLYTYNCTHLFAVKKVKNVCT